MGGAEALRARASQVPSLLFYLGLGRVPSGEKSFFFSPVVAGGTRTCDLAINSQVL